MRHLAAALAALTLVLLVAPAAQASAHNRKACGRMDSTGVLTVAKGRTSCSQARSIMRRALHLPSGGPGATNKVGSWTCEERALKRKPLTTGKVCTRGRDNMLVLRWLTRAELQQKELRAECEKQVLVSLECENAGYGSVEGAAKETAGEKEAHEREAVQRAHEAKGATREHETGSE